MHSTARPRRTWIPLPLACLLAAGCGGGGAGSSAPDPAPDTTPPAVIATAPAAGQTGVPVGTVVEVTFSEAVRNVGPATFTLTPAAGGANVDGTVAMNGNTATFTPSANLAYSVSYRATVTAGITDLANNTMAAGHSWTFGTGTAPLPCLDCHGVGGSRAGVNGAPVITRYWQTSGHGRGVAGPPLQCVDCHDVGTPAGAHAADGSGTFDTLWWPGKADSTTNPNTAHLKGFFFPVAPASAGEYALAFDNACGNRPGCHAGAGGERIVGAMSHARWDVDDPDFLMEFGNHGTPADPKLYGWYAQTAYADDFYKSQSPWIIEDLTTDAAGAPRCGTCVSCHDPHGTGTADRTPGGSNAMVRGNWASESGLFCAGACHR